MDLESRLTACRLCEARFAATKTAHVPRPVVWFHPEARLLIAGQAPGARVHASGRPFTDPSGDRLRDWMGVSEQVFYDKRKIAIVPMAFCFPGYDAKGADLPPPALCAKVWRNEVLAHLPDLRLRLLVGGAAMRWHLGAKNVTETVRAFRDLLAQGDFPLPHPSWRNTAWLKHNPWFEAELLPELRAQIRQLLETP